MKGLFRKKISSHLQGMGKAYQEQCHHSILQSTYLGTFSLSYPLYAWKQFSCFVTLLILSIIWNLFSFNGERSQTWVGWWTWVMLCFTTRLTMILCSITMSVTAVQYTNTLNDIITNWITPSESISSHMYSKLSSDWLLNLYNWFSRYGWILSGQKIKM